MDIFESFECDSRGGESSISHTHTHTLIKGVTLFVTRERGEHVNLFHSTTGMRERERERVYVWKPF